MRNLKSIHALLGLSITTVTACGGTEEPPSEETQCSGSGVICTFMGTGKAGLGHDGVAADEVLLYLPQDMAESPDGQLYVLDWNNHRVRTIRDGKVETVVGTGELGDAPEGPALSASLNHPTHVTFAPDGRMVMSAWHNSKVMAVDLEAGTLSNICGTGGRSYAGDGQVASSTTTVLDLPVATAFDSQGRMLIMDQANQRIRRIDENGIIDTIAGPSKDYVHVVDGFQEVCFGDTCKVCRDEEASDPDCEAFKFRPQGFAGDGGPATEAFFYLPFSQSAPPAGRMEMGPNDQIFIADTGNQRIRVISSDGIVNTVAGSGPDTYDPSFTGGYAGDGGPATDAMLKRPTDVAVAADGSFYIADTDNHCVRFVDTSGTISTVAGVCGERGFDGDGGAATEALLDRPYGIALGQDGTLYIADTHNHRIRVVYP